MFFNNNDLINDVISFHNDRIGYKSWKTYFNSLLLLVIIARQVIHYLLFIEKSNSLIDLLLHNKSINELLFFM